MSLKNTLIELLPHLPGANELKILYTFVKIVQCKTVVSKEKLYGLIGTKLFYFQPTHLKYFDPIHKHIMNS